MPELVLLKVADGVATLTLNRPEKLNSFADDMREQLVQAVDSVVGRAGVRVLVITGAGRAFSSGGDLKHMTNLKDQGRDFSGLRPLLELGREVVTRLERCAFPTIAAVNGPAAGGGMALALACDLRIAAESAKFGMTFVRIGLHADWGSVYHLPRLVGLARALELCWLGDLIDAKEALRIGLVNQVHPDDRFADEVARIARRLADAPATSLRMAKRTLAASFGRSLDQCLEAEMEAQAACWHSPDSTEGIRAFVEKRAAKFGAGATAGEDSAELAPTAAARRFE